MKNNTEKSKVIMFTGKGGVGKTTCSAAAALHYAGTGKTRAISTEATPSLRHIFEIDGCRTDSEAGPSLYIREIGQAEVMKMWDEKFGAEVYEVFSSFVEIGYEQFVEFMVSVLPGLADEFMASASQAIEECSKRIRHSIDEHCDTRVPTDDITLVVLEIAETPETVVKGTSPGEPGN